MCILPYDYSIGFYLYHLFWILTAVRDWSAKACCNSATALKVKGLANGRFIMSCPGMAWHHYRRCTSSAALKAGLFAKGTSISTT